MKIAMPAEGKNMAFGLCPSFGRAPYFLLYDTDTKEGIFLENSAAASPGGAGIKAAQIIVDQKAGALITPRCGENAAEVLKKAGVLVYKSMAGSAQQNIDALSEQRLVPLGDFHPGFHGHEK